MKIPREMIESLRAEDVDPTEITTSLLAMDGVKVAILFRVLDDRRIKVSLRSKGYGAVIAATGAAKPVGLRTLGRNASGIVMCSDLDRAVDVVTQRASALLASKSAPRRG